MGEGDVLGIVGQGRLGESQSRLGKARLVMEMGGCLMGQRR